MQKYGEFDDFVATKLILYVDKSYTTLSKLTFNIYWLIILLLFVLFVCVKVISLYNKVWLFVNCNSDVVLITISVNDMGRLR